MATNLEELYSLVRSKVTGVNAKGATEPTFTKEDLLSRAFLRCVDWELKHGEIITPEKISKIIVSSHLEGYRYLGNYKLSEDFATVLAHIEIPSKPDDNPEAYHLFYGVLEELGAFVPTGSP